MVAIVSSSARERAAFASLCTERGWPSTECGSLRAFRRLLHDTVPKVVLSRHKVADAYSDDVLAALISSGGFAETRMIVLLEAGSSAAQEARQIALGANSVLRDPVRTDVLVAYLEKYWSEVAIQHLAERHRLSPIDTFPFAGATVHPLERRIEHGRLHVKVTPRELELIKFLFEARGHVVTYQTLYTEMLARTFRGDTSNLRVLFGRLVASFRTIRVPLRHHIEVIAKTGYRYGDAEVDARVGGAKRG